MLFRFTGGKPAGPCPEACAASSATRPCQSSIRCCGPVSIADIAARARTGGLKPDELAGGTFTITNIGSQGALFDTPILVPPQAAMLGTGAIVKRPVVVTEPDGSDVIAIRSMSYLPLTYDHRLIDGADAGRFLTTVKKRLEGGSFAADLGL